MFRFLRRRLFRPFSRTALLLLAWNHRQTVGIWGRSLAAELRRGGSPDLGRVKRLVGSLWRLSTNTLDEELAGVRRLRVVDGDLVTIEGDGLGVDVAANVLADRITVVATGSPVDDIAVVA